MVEKFACEVRSAGRTNTTDNIDPCDTHMDKKKKKTDIISTQNIFKWPVCPVLSMNDIV